MTQLGNNELVGSEIFNHSRGKSLTPFHISGFSKRQRGFEFFNAALLRIAYTSKTTFDYSDHTTRSQHLIKEKKSLQSIHRGENVIWQTHLLDNIISSISTACLTIVSLHNNCLLLYQRCLLREDIFHKL